MATFSETTYIKRESSNDSSVTALASTSFALSSGFGSSATVAVASGTTDSNGQITITSAGSGQAFQPTCTLTYGDGTWLKGSGASASPFIVVSRVSGSQNTIGFNATASATFATLTFLGTAASGETYTVAWHLRG